MAARLHSLGPMTPQHSVKYLARTRLARLLTVTAAGAALLVTACGDASNNTGSTWHNRGPSSTPGAGKPGTPDPGTGGTNNPDDPGTTADGGGSTTQGQPRTDTDAGTTATGGGAFEVNIGQTTMTGDLLADTTTVVSVSPTGGFKGTVTLAFDPGTLVAPTQLTGKFDKATVTLSGAAASANLIVRSNSVTSVPFKVTATATGAPTISKDLSFAANTVLNIDIPADAQMNKGTTGNPRTDAFGPSAGIVVVMGGQPLTLNIKNLDATGHIIHGPNSNGFLHGDVGSPIPQGGADQPRTITGGTSNFYLHDQGQVTTGRLVIK